MTPSVVLDIAIGLVFVFLTSSLICTGILEWISNLLNKRGDYLLRGLREMLDLPPATPEAPQSSGHVPLSAGKGLASQKNRRTELQSLSRAGAELPGRLAAAAGPSAGDPTTASFQLDDHLADLVLAHPLVAVMHRPSRPGVKGGRMHLASYLSGRVFAASLIDLLVPNGAGRTSIDELTATVQKLDPNIPARDALLALLRDAGTSVEIFRRSLETWYDEQMGRVSGWYKRWAQRLLLVLGLVLAIVVNVDTMQVGRLLYRDQPVRNAVVAQAVSAQGCPASPAAARSRCLLDQRRVLERLPLPVGWDLSAAGSGCRTYSTGSACRASPARWLPYWWHGLRGNVGGALLKLLGWLLTGLAVSLGAPFWFDALSKLGSLRTAGRKPGENTPYVRPDSPNGGLLCGGRGLGQRR